MAPAAGGTPIELVACVHPRGFAAGPSGVFYVACNSEGEPSLHVIDPSTRHDRVLGTLHDFYVDLAVSPDEKTIVYDRMTSPSIRHGQLGWSADLMLIENFR